MLRERIGIGRTAEVFAWRGEQIVKLLRPGFPDEDGETEATIAAQLNTLDLAAPRFHGAERVDGRYGLVYERVRGPSMLDALTHQPWLVDALATKFAELHAEMHARSGAGLPDQAAYYGRMVDRAAENLGAARVAAVRRRLGLLAGGTSVCHGDMHPGNVILAASGPVVIDWLTAGSGPPEADLARTRFLLIESVVPGAYSRLQRLLIDALRRRFASTYLRRYRRLRVIDEQRVDLWRLPVLAARVSEAIEGEREQLLASIDAELARSGTRWSGTAHPPP